MPFPTSSLVQAGKFTDIKPIGQGAHGHVYVAMDARLQRLVAVKEARPSDQEFQRTLEKFEKESRIQARLQHPNIIAVYALEIDPDSDERYLICEYANAGSLADYLEDHGILTEPQVITVGLNICAALTHIWSEQIVHRDIKPSNILLTKDVHGALTAKLADFGIAQDQTRRPTTAQPGTHHPGTPVYMAPEQSNSVNLLDVRTDIYALGATLFELLTLKVYKLLAQHDTPRLHDHNPLTSRGIAQVIQKAVQDDRLRRYQTPEDMAGDLQAVLQGNRPTIAAAPPPRQLRRLAPALRQRLISPSLGFLAGFLTFIILRNILPALPPPLPTPTAQVATPNAPLPSVGIPTSMPSPTLRSGRVVFREDFDGPELDPSRWEMLGPPPLFRDGKIRLDSSLNFYPYIYTQENPFPAQGDFVLRVDFQYLSLTQKGVGFAADISDPPQQGGQHHIDKALLSFWQGSTKLLLVYCMENNALSSTSGNTSKHTIEYLYDGKYAIYLDGDLIYTSPATTKRPVSIWFGNPVEAIIPGVSTWTGLEIDEIVIEELGSSSAKLAPVQAGRRQFP